MKPVKIKIYSDYVCPFCYLSTGIIDKMKNEFSIEDQWLPYEVHPETPEQGDLLAECFPELDAEEFFGGLDRWGEPMGIRFSDLTLLSNSRAALELGELARDLGLNHEYHATVFKAYFTDGLDIGDREVLMRAAGEAGLPMDKANQALDQGTYTETVVQSTAQGKEEGVRAAPTFFIDGYGKLTGAPRDEVFREILQWLANGSKGAKPIVG